MGTRIFESKEDVDFAVGLTVEEGWNYTPHEIGLMLELDPEGSFIYEDNRVPLGFVTTVTYSRTGVIGHLIVSGKARGRKIGDALVSSAIQYMEGRDVDSMLLYATKEGSNLYRRHGFVPREDILCVHLNLEKGHVAKKSKSCTPISTKDLQEVISIDRELFGDDRRRILEALHKRSARSAFKIDRGDGIDGYIFARPDHVGHNIGPWAYVGDLPGEASELFTTVLSTLTEGILYTGTFAKNKEAERIFRTLPTTRSWIISTMVRGRNRYESAAEKVFAVAAFELG